MNGYQEIICPFYLTGISNGVRQSYLALDLCRQHIATHASLETMEHSTVNFVLVN